MRGVYQMDRVNKIEMEKQILQDILAEKETGGACIEAAVAHAMLCVVSQGHTVHEVLDGFSINS